MAIMPITMKEATNEFLAVFMIFSSLFAAMIPKTRGARVRILASAFLRTAAAEARMSLDNATSKGVFRGGLWCRNIRLPQLIWKVPRHIQNEVLAFDLINIGHFCRICEDPRMRHGAWQDMGISRPVSGQRRLELLDLCKRKAGVSCNIFQ
ncbi:MAG: hypothetical protein IJG13_08660, partial [Kiritimatiellae bacterium]|nr:hypothetical protein [Kiritimatiellia bacterium]